ncbi:ATP-dependent (S)-NAD(P)H-hydrate dehydratase-like [Ornithodoros turicata]
MASTNEASPSASLTSLVGVTEQQSLVCSIIPPMLYDSHKGQAGRVGIVGGSSEFTGAPFYAAMAALKLGADLAYVFCPSSAAVAIKSYSPELMVSPVLDAPNALDRLRNDYLPRLHSLIIGPGLGRSDKLLDLLPGLLSKARELHLPIVIDADGLHFVSLKPEMVRGYQRAILTPNVPEMERLHNAVLGYPPPEDKYAAVQGLARALGNVTVIAKGKDDIISDGNLCVPCREQGSPRRCGGQGDVLAGMVGTFSHWSHTARGGDDLPLRSHSPTLIAALGGAMLVRRCARQAFRKCSRSMLTTDILREIRTSFAALFPVD